jgi:alpha-mannosidase
LSDFDATPDELRVTLARATRYACDPKYAPTEKIWEPVVDCGELKFRFSLFGHEADPGQVTDALLAPPATLLAPSRKGPWARHGTLGQVTPASMQVLTVEELDADHISIRLQNREMEASNAALQLGDATLHLGRIEALQIRTFVLDTKELRACKNLAELEIIPAESTARQDEQLIGT